MFTNPVLERVYEIGIIPVIAFNSVDEALPLCKALSDGGLPAAEATFRTACAAQRIPLIHKATPALPLGPPAWPPTTPRLPPKRAARPGRARPPPARCSRP